MTGRRIPAAAFVTEIFGIISDIAGRTDLQIPYGVSDFKTIRTEGLYYVDKTEYLAKMEARDRFVFFVRPRRFGKSLFLDMLRLYYDRNEKENFERLFGGLWIGAHPTPNRNRYLMLKLDFSEVGKGAGATLDEKFDDYLTVRLDGFAESYPEVFDSEFQKEVRGLRVGMKFDKLLQRAKLRGKPVFLVIDEYDNFTNELIRSAGNDSYKSITHGAGFYRRWFKTFKASFDRIFMTGVSPVTMDDLTSGGRLRRGAALLGVRTTSTTNWTKTASTARCSRWRSLCAAASSALR